MPYLIRRKLLSFGECQVQRSSMAGSVNNEINDASSDELKSDQEALCLAWCEQLLRGRRYSKLFLQQLINDRQAAIVNAQKLYASLETQLGVRVTVYNLAHGQHAVVGFSQLHTE